MGRLVLPLPQLTAQFDRLMKASAQIVEIVREGGNLKATVSTMGEGRLSVNDLLAALAEYNDFVVANTAFSAGPVRAR